MAKEKPEPVDEKNTNPSYWEEVLRRDAENYGILREEALDDSHLPLEAAGLNPDDNSEKVYMALTGTGGFDIDFNKPTSWNKFYSAIEDAINALREEQGASANICLGLRISCQTRAVVVTVYASQSGGFRRHINTMNLSCTMQGVARRLEKKFPEYSIRYIDGNNYTLR